MIEIVIFVILFVFISIVAIVNSWNCSKSDEVLVELLEEKEQWKERYLSAQADLVDARAKINFYRNELEEKENVK